MDHHTSEVEKLFHISWKETLRRFELFDKGGFEKLRPVKTLIEDLIEIGENKNLRLGTSFYDLIFSRSKENGLRSGQHRIRLSVVDKNEFYLTYSDGKVIQQDFKLSDLKDERLIDLLNTLKGTKID